MPPPRSLAADGCGLLLQTGLILRHVLIDFLDCALVGVAILFLKQAGEDVEFAGGPIQIVIGEFSPPRFGLASDLLPLAFEYVFVYGRILLILSEAVPVCAGARGSIMRRFFKLFLSARWHHLMGTFAATLRKCSATRSGVSPLLINASAPAESAAC